MILFSILVHEKPDVVINQLTNFKAYNPDSITVLHISANMPESDYRLLKEKLSIDFPYVFCNPVRLFSGYGDGTQFKMHVENIRFALKEKLNFSHFCLHASNDMFVQSGLYDYIREYDAGYNIINSDSELDAWEQFNAAKLDYRFQKRVKKLNYKVFGGQVEGSFYSKAVLEKMISELYLFKYEVNPRLYAHGYSRWTNFFNKNLRFRYYLAKLTGCNFYAKEELFFATFSQGFVKKHIRWMYCYVNWEKQLLVTQRDIENIRTGHFRNLDGMNELDLSLKYFAVKRIDRNMNDELRQFITSSQPSVAV